MKKKALIPIGVVVLLLVGFYLAFVKEDSVSENGNVYTRAEYGLSFVAPEGYELMEANNRAAGRHTMVLSQTEDTVVPENGEGPTAITIDFFEDPEPSNPAIWVKENNLSNFRLGNGRTEDIAVDGTNGITYEWDGLYRGRSVVFLHQGNMVMVSGTYLEKGDPIYSHFDEVVQSIKLN